jgi:AcrR family transcriptional regulator
MKGGLNERKTDPRIARTTGLIDDAFIALLGEKGFEKLAVQDITERAGINRATFYAHYCDKYALLRRLVRRNFAEELATQGVCNSDLSVQSVHRLILAVCGYIEGLHTHCKPPHEQLDWLLETEVKELLREVISSWIRASASRTDSVRSVDPEMIATAASSAIYGVSSQWMSRKERPPKEILVASMLPLITGILAVSTDIQELD